MGKKKVLHCEECGWEESELSRSGYASAGYHQRLYGHHVKLIEKK